MVRFFLCLINTISELCRRNDLFCVSLRKLTYTKGHLSRLCSILFVMNIVQVVVKTAVRL